MILAGIISHSKWNSLTHVILPIDMTVQQYDHEYNNNSVRMVCFCVLFALQFGGCCERCISVSLPMSLLYAVC